MVGIIPLTPISITVSPSKGSYKLFPPDSIHSKLLFIDRETSITTSWVSLPVITKGVLNEAVTTHEPAGMGEEANKGLGTVVASGGACPVTV